MEVYYSLPPTLRIFRPGSNLPCLLEHYLDPNLECVSSIGPMDYIIQASAHFPYY